MNSIFRVLTVACMFSTTFLLHGQVSYGGLAFGLMENGPELPQAPIQRLPQVDAAALIAEDEASTAQGKQGPYRFGFNHEVNITMDAGIWTELANGDRIWRSMLECPDAHSIGVVFSRYVIPEGALVFFYNDAGEQRGAYMAAPKGRTTYAIDQLAGERITIEYFEPAAVRGMGELEIGIVTHDYRDVTRMQRGFGDSGSCNINVICPEGDDWRDQIRSVALINVGGGLCTGTLINNCEGDGIPYFLTAHHCLGSNTENWIFRFNWDSPECEPSEDFQTVNSISGAELLESNENTDMAFLELFETPPEEYNVFYSGWDISDQPADSVTAIHHPSGDIKKISHSFNPVLPYTATIGGQSVDSWHVQAWDLGTTEQGSSGSGLWNEFGLLVGQLFGGAANCNNNVDDYYGRFDLSYPLLEEYLGECGPQLPGLGSDIVIPGTVDAAVTSITNVPLMLCGDSLISPHVTLKNNGDDVITSLIINYGLQGGIPEIIVWNGSLMPDQTVNFQLPGVLVPPGEHVFEVTCNSPNGEQDQVEENDVWLFAFSVNFPSENTTLELVTDAFGADITWELATSTGTVLYTGGPYQNGMNGQQISVPFCLTNGCYVFSINDEFGDGICCAEGDGHYVIQNSDSVVFAINDGQYGDGNVDVFCLEGVSVGELEAGELTLFPNPTNGLLELRFDGLIEPMQITITDGLGRTLSTRQISENTQAMTLDLSAYADGVYLLSFDTARGRIVRRVTLQR